jgi:hypothetical protein
MATDNLKEFLKQRGRGYFIPNQKIYDEQDIIDADTLARQDEREKGLWTDKDMDSVRTEAFEKGKQAGWDEADGWRKMIEKMERTQDGKDKRIAELEGALKEILVISETEEYCDCGWAGKRMWEIAKKVLEQCDCDGQVDCDKCVKKVLKHEGVE